MRILALESSCDETAAAIVSDGREILSSLVASQILDHAIYGGVVPEVASRKHVESISALTRQALDCARLNLQDLDAIAVTYAPGLIGSLLVGVNFAKGLSFASGLPLVPVHHLRAHVAANYIAHIGLTPPFLCLVVSGGHTHIVDVTSFTHFTLVGRTRDDAAGEAFDKAARCMGLEYPGGVHLDKLAVLGDSTAFDFKRPCVSGSLYDFSFSGLKTAIVNLIHNARQKGESLSYPDLAASFREAVVEYLIFNFMRAARDLGHRKLCIAGGVAANSRLRERLTQECYKESLHLYLPPLDLCGDNAAMVGAQAYFEFLAGSSAGLSLNALASASLCD